MIRRLSAFLIPLTFLMGTLLLRGVPERISASLWILSSALITTGLLAPRSQVFGRTIFQGPPQPRVALTFDDGPHPEDTPAILGVLAAAGARATFFFVGKKAREHPELVREVARSGHEVEAHSDTHPWWFSLAGKGRLRREVRRSVATLTQLSGRRPRFFRPPMGHKGLSLEETLREEGLEMVTWSARPFDTVSRSPQAIQTRLLDRARPGGILLLHEGIRRQNGHPSRAVQALPGLLRGLRERGLEPVSLGDLLGRKE